MTLFPDTAAHDPGGKTKLPLLPGVRGDAFFSPCERYRLSLRRWWTGHELFGGNFILWIGMNPSTAAGHIDDPTVRRWQEFTRREGFSAMVVCNVADYRATSPRALLDLDEPVSPDNLSTIRNFAMMSHRVVACWGAIHREIEPHAARVLDALHGIDVWCLGKTTAGSPRHPLYLKGDTPLEMFRASLGGTNDAG